MFFIVHRIKRMYRKVRTVLTNMYSLGNLIIYNSRKEFLYYNALCSKEVGVVTSQGTTDSVVVSITTYGKRIYEVHLVIESLLLQTLPPYKIILWLAEDEFNEQNIPLVLKKQASRGLEINFCKDIKSYKKLIPTIEKYPGSIIITVDDDVLYAYDFIENLYKEYLSDKNCIYCYRAHKIVLDKTGIPLPYSKWKHNYQGNEKMMELFPTGVGGILYPPNCFHKDILRSDLFTQLAPSADDIWFKAMTLLQKIPCKKVPNIHPNIDLTENQDMALCHKNVGKQKNDEQLKQTFNYYNLWDSLKKSFTTSHEYWEKRYLTGGNSGAGSYNNLAKFKAEVINHFVNENNISSVIEFGCGDGNQLSLFNFTSYIGYDVSNTALEICREKFKYDTSKQFKLMVTTQGREEKNNGVDNDVADLTLSLDVIYHLVEDDVYENYMQVLFSSSRKFVIVYASNMDKATSADHVRHRNFGNYVKEKHPTFDLIHFIPNKYQYSEKEPDTTSFADFYIYKRK